jgi:hypothetical protein
MSHLVFGSFDKYIGHRTWDIPTSDIGGDGVVIPN